MTGPVVALFGGSFNPPHLAHQMACLVVLEAAEIDQVWMIPTYRHVFGKQLAAFDDRVAMCELAARPFGSRVHVSTVERDLGGQSSRTLDTLIELGRRHPDHRFRLVIGSDILAERTLWYRWDEVVRLAPPLVLARTGAEPSDSTEVQGEACGPPLPAISSSEVRDRLQAGQAVSRLVSRPVLDYIAGRGLYR